MAQRMIQCLAGWLMSLALGTGAVQAAGWADSLFPERLQLRPGTSRSEGHARVPADQSPCRTDHDPQP